MTITLTTTELSEFANELAKWYNAQLIFVFENIPTLPYLDLYMARSETVQDKIRKLRERFEKEHSKPDWRTLL